MDDARELRAAVDLVGLGRYRQDPVTQLIEWDARLKAMWGLPPDAPVDLGLFLAGIHPDDRDRVGAALGQSVDPEGDGVCDIEYRVVGVNGDAERWVATRGKTVFDQGRVISFHGVVLDISERKRAEHANMILIAELEHRTRNLLAVVDALAEQTLMSCTTLADFEIPFRERLATLSRVQGLLSRGETSPVTIGELVALELHALGADADGQRVIIEGPEVALPNRSVQILALGLHELATNARKHGALGAPDGRLSVRWQVNSVDGKRRLALAWAEDGLRPPRNSDRGCEAPEGGAITGASRRVAHRDVNHVGLGRTLIEQSIPYQLDAETRLEIHDDTVRCDMLIALERTDTAPAWNALR